MTAKVIINNDIFNNISLTEIKQLLKLKKPLFMAEMQIDCSWLRSDLKLLGEITLAYMNVDIYDNGYHTNPIVHNTPINGNLYFVPSLLLRNDLGLKPIDWDVVNKKNKINLVKFIDRYISKLTPILLSIDLNNVDSIVTIPGLGCGCFSGPFNDLAPIVFKSIIEVVKRNKFKSIKGIIFDGHKSVKPLTKIINGVNVISSPLHIKGIGQLSNPKAFGFDNCQLNTIVAWDHCSWPGNDFYAGFRVTDDGVKAAATNVMSHITGHNGHYDPRLNMYVPEYSGTWGDIVKNNNCNLTFNSVERY